VLSSSESDEDEDESDDGVDGRFDESDLRFVFDFGLSSARCDRIDDRSDDEGVGDDDDDDDDDDEVLCADGLSD